MNDTWSKIVALASQADIDRMPLSELAARLGLKHRSQAKHYKEKAVADRLLVRDGTGRLRPAPSASNPSLITLPVMGIANCGKALAYADDQITGTLSLSPSTLRRKPRDGSFAVKAVGDSMNKANISGKTLEDGDLAIVEPLSWSLAADGDYILSIIDGMANIKRLRLDTENQCVILKSESRYDLFEDIIIYADDLYMYSIAGRIVDVIKNYAVGDTANVVA